MYYHVQFVSYFIRRPQERERPWLDRIQQDEEHLRPRKIQEEEKQKWEELSKKKENENKSKQEVQEKLNKLFHPHKDSTKPDIQAPWSTAGIKTLSNLIMLL